MLFLQSLVVGAFDHGVDHLFKYLDGRTLPTINRDELAQLLRGRSLVHHDQHPSSFEFDTHRANKGSFLFLLLHAPPQHRDTRNCSREAILPRVEAIVADVFRELRVLHVRLAVGHEHRCNTKCLCLVCVLASDRSSRRQIQHSPSLVRAVCHQCIKYGFEQMCDRFRRPWSAQL